MTAAPSRYQFIAEATTAGLLFLLTPVAGYFLGKWLGEWLGLGRIPAYVGAALGLASAFVNLLRLVGRISR
jgi:putative F0F1-ATPase subunit (Ca2+/Mg2+ transporter)